MWRISVDMKRKRNSSPSNKSRSKYISEQNARPDPFEQFEDWFRRARMSKRGQPNAMALATAGADGKPTARIVLLKDVDERGFCFYTNYESVKGRQLQENRQAALLFYWPEIERQVRIEGIVEKLTREESFKYFSSRPKKSRVGAWASHQSQFIEDRAALDLQFRNYEERFRNTDVPLPDYWGGYRLIPSKMEFWQSRPNRLHDRITYTREGASWKIVRLSP